MPGSELEPAIWRSIRYASIRIAGTLAYSRPRASSITSCRIAAITFCSGIAITGSRSVKSVTTSRRRRKTAHFAARSPADLLEG